VLSRPNQVLHTAADLLVAAAVTYILDKSSIKVLDWSQKLIDDAGCNLVAVETGKLSLSK
jgi:hypothetical protein